MDRDTALQKFEHYMVREGYSQNTIQNYLRAVGNNVPEKEVEKLRQEDLDEAKLRLMQKYKIRGNRIRFSAMNLFCEEILQRPNLHLTLPRPKTKNKDVLTRKQVNKILSAAREDSKRSHALILTMYDCALRKGELINLDLSDVKYETNELCIRDAKTGDGVVTISDRALKAIEEYVQTERQPENDGETALFLNSWGRRIGEKTVRYYVKKYAAQAGITRRVYPHIFRASCITHLLNDHVNPATVQHHARHKNFATTMLYNRPTQQQMHRDIKQSFDGQSVQKPEKDQKQTSKSNSPEEPATKPTAKKPADPSNRIEQLVDKLLAGEISEETFKTVVATLNGKQKVKNIVSMYV